jgi:hypothetical protein
MVWQENKGPWTQKEELTFGVSVLPVRFLLNLSRHTPPILSATFFGWIPQLLRIPEGEMLDIVGLDAVMVRLYSKGRLGRTKHQQRKDKGRSGLQFTHATSNVLSPNNPQTVLHNA